MGTAFLLTAAYLLVVGGGAYFYLEVGPMILGTIIGALLGDLKTGIIMGGSIEAMYLGVMNIGGTLPADKNVATVISTAYVIQTGCDIATGIAVAYPLGTLAGQLYMISTPFFSMLDIFYDKLIYGNKGDMKKFAIAQHAGYWIYELIAQVICIFVFLSVGVEVFQAVLNQIPASVMTGLNAAGNMMIAAGLGLTLQLIWSPALGGFFFIGFFLSSIMGMNSIQIALVGTGLAFFYYSLIANKASGDEGTEELATNDGGDFFA